MSYIGKQPRKAALTSSDIEDGIITAAKIEDGAVVAAEIASNAVTTAKINADAVTSAKIADNAVVTAAINADAVTAAKIADDAISEEHLDVTAITGHTAETTVNDSDLVVIHDASASALRKMTVANLTANAGVAGISSSADATAITISSDENVGIGETSPVTLADFAAPGLTIKSDAPFIAFKDGNNANKSVYIGNQGGIFSIGEMDDDLSSNKTEAMRISNTGQVSIGTTSSTHHLHVDANGQTTDSWIKNGSTVSCSGSWGGSKEVRVDWGISSSVSYILEFIVASYGTREHFVVGSYYAGNSHQTVMTQNGSDSMTQGGNSGGERWQSSGGTHGVYCVRLTSANGTDDALVTLI